ncbi:MAG: SiaC family regulatory phosphoprotein [Bacteroidia bacterium]|nr:DUF1987 domain-containing protein [Bacteroidia bacterium]MDW8134315.1 SiaC family regulatory phosphoprotein [Bacteroidia bacterium]
MPFHISPSLHTPEVLISPEENRIVIKGSCFPEDSIEFFRPIKNFIVENKIFFTKDIEIHVELTYINSSSQRALYQILSEVLSDKNQLKLIIYQGEEDEELENLSLLVRYLRDFPWIQIKYEKGYYSGSTSSTSSQETPPSKR